MGGRMLRIGGPIAAGRLHNWKHQNSEVTG